MHWMNNNLILLHYFKTYAHIHKSNYFHTCITHAALHILCFTIRKTVPLKALSFLNTWCSIFHGLGLWALSLGSQAPWLIFTGSWLLLTTFDSMVHVLTALAARRVAVTATSLRSQLTVFVTTHINIILSHKPSITLFLSLYTLVTTVWLLWFSEAPWGFGNQHSTNCSQTAWRKPL